MQLLFGRQEHDPAALAAAPRHLFSVRPAAPVVDRSKVNYAVNMYDNNLYGDCTCVALANYARGVAALNEFDLPIDTTAVTTLFGDVGGTDNLAAIPGLAAMDVIAYQAAHGFDIGSEKLVGVAGTVAITRNDLSHAIERLGGAYLGIRLYERDMETFGTGTVWNLRDGVDYGKLVGRHMINGWDYDTSSVRVGTWATLQRAGWAWLLSRLDEAYALVWRQLARAKDGLFYDGVNADGMISEMGA